MLGSSDLPVIIRYNLNQEGQSGGPNNEADKPWHGTGYVLRGSATRKRESLYSKKRRIA
jgi:hypothetical protein